MQDIEDRIQNVERSTDLLKDALDHLTTSTEHLSSAALTQVKALEEITNVLKTVHDRVGDLEYRVQVLEDNE